MAKKAKSAAKSNQTAPYKHPEAKSLMRPEVGTQAQFKKKKAPKTYRYDSSLSPALDWDAKNPAREQGEQLIKQVLDAKTLEEAKAAASKLRSLGKPFLIQREVPACKGGGVSRVPRLPVDWAA